MTFVYALIALIIVGVIVGGVVLLLRKRKLPLPRLRILKARPSERSPQQEEAALRELAQRAVSRYPELGSTPAELLAEINAYCNKAHTRFDSTSRIILEKMLTAASLKQAMSYWQVRAFLDYRDKLKKSR